MSTCHQKIIEILNIISKTEGIVSEAGLLGGKTGLYTALLVHAVNSRDREFERAGEKLIETVFKELEHAESYVYSFSNGLAGIGWTLELLEQKGYAQYDTNSLLEDFDVVLAKVLEFEMNNGHYDFLRGALGVVLYFIRRMPKKEDLLPVLQKFVVQLNEMGEKQPTGSIKWSSVLDIETQKTGYNISLSHGMASIVVILSKLYAIKGIDQKMVQHLLQGCVNYILEQEIDKDKYGSFFPSYALESTEQIYGSRLAWCYGDLGISMALWQAGVALQNETWKNKALTVLLFAAEKRRDLQKNLVIDACLCHGTAGAGHLFYRAWRNTGMSEFKNTADYWFEQTLKMAKFDDGLAGYKAWLPHIEKWANVYGLLEGIAGTGLALLTYYHEIEPTWDECLLLS